MARLRWASSAMSAASITTPAARGANQFIHATPARPTTIHSFVLAARCLGGHGHAFDHRLVGRKLEIVFQAPMQRLGAFGLGDRQPGHEHDLVVSAGISIAQGTRACAGWRQRSRSGAPVHRPWPKDAQALSGAAATAWRCRRSPWPIR
jgi:hypothetical protein